MSYYLGDEPSYYKLGDEPSYYKLGQYYSIGNSENDQKLKQANMILMSMGKLSNPQKNQAFKDVAILLENYPEDSPTLVVAQSYHSLNVGQKKNLAKLINDQIDFELVDDAKKLGDSQTIKNAQKEMKDALNDVKIELKEKYMIGPSVVDDVINGNIGKSSNMVYYIGGAIVVGFLLDKFLSR